jgi:hypothetical protein
MALQRCCINNIDTAVPAALLEHMSSLRPGGLARSNAPGNGCSQLSMTVTCSADEIIKYISDANLASEYAIGTCSTIHKVHESGVVAVCVSSPLYDARLANRGQDETALEVANFRPHKVDGSTRRQPHKDRHW